MDRMQLLRGIELLQDLADDELQNVANLLVEAKHGRGDYVFMQGEEQTTVYFITRGLIKIVKLDEEGREHVVNILAAGQMFPHTGFFAEGHYPGTAEVISDCTLFMMPSKRFEQLMMDCPQIMKKVMKVMERRIRQLQTRLRDIVVFNSQERVEALLRFFVDEYGEEREDGMYVKLPVTNAEMAHMIGLTRESVNRTLKQLRTDEILTTTRNEWILSKTWYQKRR